MLVLPVAAAAVEEIALPPDSRPLALAFAPDGKLWVTLDGAWALGEFDPATSNLTVHPLAAPPAPGPEGQPQGAPGDSLFALRRGPDGAWWTASQTNLHRVGPDGNTSAWPLPRTTLLAGDVAFADGKVLVALVTADAIGVFDVVSETWTVLPTPTRFGPLHFASDEGGLLVSGTYAGTVAAVDLAGSTFPLVSGDLAGPVGIDASQEDVWAAEMGASSVARQANARDAPLADVARFPTSPSPFYPSSGPADVVVLDDGTVWLVEHFADRVGRLDPEAGTLVEWMMPSAPGTNMQRLAVGPDGRAWVAQWSTSKLAWIRDDGGHAFPALTPGSVTIEAGREATVASDRPVAAAGSATPGITARPTSDGVVVTVGATVAPGEHLVLVSAGQQPLLAGRYLHVTVVEPAAGAPPAQTPALAVATVLLVLACAARWRR